MTANSTKPSLFPLFLALIIFAATGWYGYNKYVEIDVLKTHVAEADQVLGELEVSKNESIRDYQKSKKIHTNELASNEEKLISIFPYEEDITSLTRLLDDFAFKNHYRNNPFFISQLSYGSAIENDGENYRVVPVTLSLETSDKNFYKFLEFVDNSGSMENGIRLLATNGVTLQLADEKSDQMSVQLSLEAYIQKTSL
jgi:hypothetical protein